MTPETSIPKYTVAEDRAFLESKIYTFVVREAGHKFMIETYPDMYEADDPVAYMKKLRLYDLDNPEAFSDADLDSLIAAAVEKQKETGESTEAFWRFMTSEPTKEELAEKEWSHKVPSGCNLIHRELKPRKALITHSGTPVFFESSINMLWAYRGLGKSLVALALAKLFTQGGEWLGFKSDGGHGVLLVDGELPAVQLKERINEFVGEGSMSQGELRVWSPEFTKFPDFGHDPKGTLWTALAAIRPKIVIFDTLTRCFKIDTNDSEDLLALNDGLIRLRQRGYCVILVHHAGKNATQRGRTDIDDNLDVSVKLDKPYGWEPGDGLAFKWSYEKVRHGGYLQDFEATYDGSWSLVEDPRLPEILEMSRAGKTTRAIAQALDLSQSAVSRAVRKAKAVKLGKLNG